MTHTENKDILKPTNPSSLILEAWSQGFMVGSLIVMAAITVSNMRRGVFLHKLILIELIFGMPHGTFIFPNPPAYGWYLSATAIFLNMSWSMHNVVAWMKSKPFLSRRVSLIYIGTVILVQPYWVLEIYANWVFFNNINVNLFPHTRPWEALFRDPWWTFTTVNLFWNIKRRYEFSLLELIRVSPRFGVLLGSMLLSVGFIITDIVSVTRGGLNLPDGLNPFWKLAFVFKCLTDTIILDDFKTALDRLKRYNLQRMNPGLECSDVGTNGHSQSSTWRRGTEFAPWNESTGVTHVDRELQKQQHSKLAGQHGNGSGGFGGAAVPTAMAKPQRALCDNIDLEMAYWVDNDRRERGRGDSSTTNRSDGTDDLSFEKHYQQQLHQHWNRRT